MSRRCTATCMLIIVIMSIVISAAASRAQDAGKADPSVVRRELKDILSQPEYNRVEKKGFIRIWLDKAARWLKTVINKIIRFLIPDFGKGAGRLASLIFAALALGAFLALLALMLRYVSLSGRAPSADDITPESYQIPSPGPLIKKAAALADAGDYRGAYRCAYLACIAYLDEARALRFERSRTNWEYLRELQAGGHLRPYELLHPLTLDFDRKFYGGGECSGKDYENALAVYRSISSEGAQ